MVRLLSCCRSMPFHFLWSVCRFVFSCLRYCLPFDIIVMCPVFWPIAFQGSNKERRRRLVSRRSKNETKNILKFERCNASDVCNSFWRGRGKHKNKYFLSSSSVFWVFDLVFLHRLEASVEYFLLRAFSLLPCRCLASSCSSFFTVVQVQEGAHLPHLDISTSVRTQDRSGPQILVHAQVVWSCVSSQNEAL